jgi:hypothetical protein
MTVEKALIIATFVGVCLLIDHFGVKLYKWYGKTMFGADE